MEPAPRSATRSWTPAFKLALDGVPLVALHRNTRFQTADGPALDMGAFVVGLEAAAGIEVTVVGSRPPPSSRPHWPASVPTRLDRDGR